MHGGAATIPRQRAASCCLKSSLYRAVLHLDPGYRTLKEKLIKIGAKVVGHARYVAFQMAEAAIPRNLFADILRMIAELRPPPLASTA